MSSEPFHADEARHRLYGIMKRDGPFEEKANAALDVGVEYLDVDTAFITRIDERANSWETILSTDDSGPVPTGRKAKLSNTYCQQTLERDSPLAAGDVQASESIQDPNENILCYHGTTLEVDGSVFGTVCFVSEEPRSVQFGEAETMFAELVGRMLEHELKQKQKQDELGRQTSLVNLLDRVLRHNIRNDMTIIRANARLHAEQHDGCTECETIVRRAEKLIDLSENARTIGKIINTEYEYREVDIQHMVSKIASETAENYPAATITIEGPGELVVPILPSLETAVRELVENAAEYAGDAPDITITVGGTTEGIDIQVADDGPGLPQPEQDALQAGTETSLAHGSGLGLWTVYWAVARHDGSLSIDAEDGTTVTVSIPAETEVIEEGSVGSDSANTTSSSTEDRRPTDRTPERKTLTDERQDNEKPGADASLPSESSDATPNQPQIPRVPDRYRIIFEEAGTPMVLFDDGERLHEVNDRAAALFGQPASKLIGQQLNRVLSTPERNGDKLLISEEGTVSVTSDATDERRVSYHVTRDILPGYHFAIFQG